MLRAIARNLPIAACARCKLGSAQLRELEALLDAGPAALGLGGSALDAGADRRGGAPPGTGPASWTASSPAPTST